jgi:hypothetical protein
MPASAGRLGLQLFKMNLQPSGWDEPGSYLQVEMQPFFPQEEGEEQGVRRIGLAIPIPALTKSSINF